MPKRAPQRGAPPKQGQPAAKPLRHPTNLSSPRRGARPTPGQGRKEGNGPTVPGWRVPPFGGENSGSTQDAHH